MTTTLPRFLRELLASVPPAGGGVHGWLFRVARQLHSHLPAIEIISLLETHVVNCGRRVSRKEIENAVKNSIECAWGPRGSSTVCTLNPERAWPGRNLERLEAIGARGFGLADLWEASPIRIEDNIGHADEIVDRLFPGNPLLCCGWHKSHFDTKPREDWRGQMANLQLIVPSPMSAITGPKADGTGNSKHTLANTGYRRFLVIEFDTGTLDDHAGLLWHLAGYGPLVLVVHSGSKSLHGWFYCASESEERLRKFMRYAVTLGADPATWGKCQFCRMPDGLRDSSKRQTTFYFNPQVIPNQKP